MCDKKESLNPILFCAVQPKIHETKKKHVY
jgi:hypothetical protein